MKDLIRLMISNERIINSKNNTLKLTDNEDHYVNKVMRIKNGETIYVTNGIGSLWKAKKFDNNYIEIIQFDKPYLFKLQENILLGIAVVIPRNGFEDILKMCTEIGIDFIQPLFSERQVNKNLNLSKKTLRWNSIINEAVEQSERLWRPSVFDGLNVIDWIKNRDNQDRITISVTREDSCDYLNIWLKKQHNFSPKKELRIFWNLIGPEGGWSSTEKNFFIKNKIPMVKLSETILRTSTACINASSILNQWRNELKLEK